MVRKANAFEIINHWTLALSFFILSISGFGFLFHLEQLNAVFGSFNNMRIVHNWVGLAFAASLFFTLFSYLPEALRFGADEIRWMLKGGGYFSKGTVVPPQGKLNAGQKIYYLTLLVMGAALTVTGLIIWFKAGIKSLVLISHLIHNLSFDLLIVAIPLHIYLATIANPGTVRIMIYGTVPLEWARKRHARWIKKMGL
jgi:formate dehydrogenase subunit gamma